MIRHRRLLAAISLMVLSTGSVWCQDQAQDPCSSPKSHQFDFWIGDWDVTAQGNTAGINRIHPIANGCVLLEQWEGAAGVHGASMNFYNPTTGQWHQFWVWQNGTTLPMLSGEYRDGKMVLEGEQTAKDGQSVHMRITWYDNPDGSVRQHWETSRDGRQTWKTNFDGLYRKRMD